MNNEIEFNKNSDCETKGHSLVKVFTGNNSQSFYGQMMCQKCGKVYEWQYDFMQGNGIHP